MKKTFHAAVSAIAFGAVFSMNAAHVSPEQAFNRVKSTRSGFVDVLSFRHAATIGSLYVFSDRERFLILPDNDLAPEVLAYSDNGFSLTDMNPELRYWLDNYNKELSWLSAKSGSTERTGVSRRSEKKPIAPLTLTKWNQEGPYNMLCPKVDGRGTVTGCVATAMAQVLKFYSYPTKGYGEHSYFWEPGEETLSFNFGETTFEWDNMTDTYDAESSEESKEAVAKLMLACGISVDMHYDVGDSGASTMRMGGALIDYFGYDKGLWMPMRDYYGLYDWENMIYDELKEGRPVLYSGQGTGGGHQFICDGYSSDGFFHFNWGWGGLSNGYFRLTALNPADLGVGGGAGGFNSGQQISLGVKPGEGDSGFTYLMYCSNHFLTDQRTVDAGQRLTFRGGFYNFSLTRLPDGSVMGVKITTVGDSSADGEKTRYEAGFNISGLGGLEGFGEDFFRFPELPDGTYIITPAFYDGKKWHDIQAPVGAVGSCKATVKDYRAILAAPEAAYVDVEEIKVPETIFVGRSFPLEFTVVNTTEDEFLGRVTPVLMSLSENKVVAESVYRPVDVGAGGRERITDYIGDFSALKGDELTPGEYWLFFRDGEGKRVSEQVKVTLEANPGDAVIKVTGFRLDGEDPVTDKEKVKFTFAVTCEDGYFTDRIHLYIFPGDYGRDVAGASSDMIYLQAGDKHYGDVIIDLSGLKAGEYIAVLYHGSAMVSDEIRFRISPDTGVNELTPENVGQNPVILDLSGRIYPAAGTDSLLPGVYIINGKKILIREN